VSRYLGSRKNVTGCALAVGGVCLVVTGSVGAVAGLVLVPALYAIGVLAAPPRREHVDAAVPDRRDVRRSLRETQRRSSHRVPRRIARKINKLSVMIEHLMPRVDTLGPGSQTRFVVVQCATDYLPTAVQSYLDLPRKYADHHVVADGNTPLQLLGAQLDLLQQQLDEIAGELNRTDSDKLVVHGRFLADKFGADPFHRGRRRRS
jgi:hypothetical protein